MTDVIIIGGGFPGLVAALAFAKLNVKVKLFDVKSSLADSQSHAFKPIVLNAASWQLLSALELSQKLSPQAYGLRKMHVLRERWSKFSFAADKRRHPCLGYVVMGTDLQNQLAQAVENNSNITCFLSADITTVQAGSAPMIVADGAKHHANLLIVADGRQSKSRQALKMDYDQMDWQKSALVSAVTLEKPLEDAYLRFITGGTAACLPSARGKHQIIVAKASKDPIFSQDKADVLKTLQRHMAGVADIKSLDQHMVFPLGQGIAPQVAMPGAILLGDAGFAIPPVGAQGLNLAFFDVAVLIDLASEAMENEVAFSSAQFAERFNVTVKPHHDRLLKGVKSLMTLFDLESSWLQMMHGMALSIANIVSPFKRYVAEFGMGFRYPMPHLIRGHFPKQYARVERSGGDEHA